MVNWELKSVQDKRDPLPSIEQQRLRSLARARNQTTLILTDLDRNERELADLAIGRGLPMLEALANFSLGMDDISLYNIRTASRVERYYQRFDWKDKLRYQ